MKRKYIILIIALSIGGLLFFQNLYQEMENKKFMLLADKLEKEMDSLENEMFIEHFPKVLSDSCPIRVGTTKIRYQYHTNSGMARYSDYQIFRDSIVWNYYEARNHCHLKDMCIYDKSVFNKLIKELSEKRFSGTFDLRDRNDGGAGFYYYFEEDSLCYLQYNESYQLSGEYQEVDYLIKQFIENHKTQCEILFEKYSNKPHEKALYGEFQSLPPKLQEYIVK